MVAPTRDVARRRLLRPRSGASALAEARDWGPAHDADDLPFPEKVVEPVVDDALMGGEEEGLKRHSAVDCHLQVGEGLSDYLWKTDFACLGQKWPPPMHPHKLIFGDYQASRLGPWLSLGNLSPRKVFQECLRFCEHHGNDDADPRTKHARRLITELTWRDFFRFYAGKHGTLERWSVAAWGGSVHQRWQRKDWMQDERIFQLWSNGRTGYPLVDACMRELSITGYTSNHARMNAASFLACSMSFDWRRGANWFESHLIDYDVTSNWCNWVRCAGLTESRLSSFNVVRQSQKFDPMGLYLRRWLPELQEVPPELIHEPWLMTSEELVRYGASAYPQPCVDPSFFEGPYGPRTGWASWRDLGGTREEVRVAAVPLLEATYTRLLERALSVQAAGLGPPPGAAGESGARGSGEGTPGAAEAGASGKSGDTSPGKSGAAAPGTTGGEEAPPPGEEEGGGRSRGRGLPPLARLRKRDRRDEGEQAVETEVKEEQTVDKSGPLVDVKEKRSDKKKEKERSHKSRASKEGREEEPQRRRSRERNRSRRSRSRSRRRDRRRREKTPPRSPSVGAEPLPEGGESEAGEPEQDKEIPEEEAEERPRDRPKPREPEGPPPGYERSHWGGHESGLLAQLEGATERSEDMAPKRRPAAEAGRPRVVRRRPAALDGEVEDQWVPADEVTLAQMEGWAQMRVQGEYWEEAVDCTVEMIELRASRGDRELLGKAVGTSSEALLRYISGVPEKTVRLHLCGRRCDRKTWEDGLIHVTQLKQHRAGEVSWEKNLESSRAEAERDELERVRLEAAARGKGRGLPAGPKAAAEKVDAPGVSGESEEQKKKKKKKKKTKLRMEPVKDHTTLFKNTGMDADPVKRKRFRRRAKKLTKKSRNKDSASTGSSESSDSSSKVSEGEDYFGELFTPQTSTQRMWERLPGVLTAQLLQDAQRSMLLQMGSMASTSGQLQPLTSQYVRQQMGASMSPVIYREAIHWAATLDLMVQGKVASACDVMSQRLKSLEALAKGMKVDLIKQLELIQVENYGLASSSELHQAGRTAHEENKIYGKATGRFPEYRDRFRDKGKAKGEKGESKDKDRDKEKGKKDKGDGKKKH
ncbi:Cryptochrome DASH [Durusdinium trenchii]|uniref:Cryptochrome DASH n=1 Tax=Durusdinium trenchii TaxID=1381693 RepID=A0ABP0P2Y3_9DINO